MTITLNKLTSIFLSLVLYLVEFLIIGLYASEINNLAELNRVYNILILINLSVQILTLYLSGYRLISGISLFLIFVYVFHFGQVILEGRYNYDYLNYYQIYMSRDFESLKSTLSIVLFSCNATHLGALLCAPDYSNVMIDQTSVDETFERALCKSVGVVLFLISTPFRLLQDVYALVAAMSGGYHAAIRALSIPGVFVTISGFWYSAIIFLYIGYNNRKILYFGTIYTILTMLSGNRGHQFTNIIVMLLTYIRIENIEFKPKKVLSFGIFAYAMIVFIDVIMNFRSVGIRDFFNNFTYYLSISLGANIIFETIGSFGETIFTPFLVVQQMGNGINPFLGQSWIYSILSIIPNIGGTLTNIHNAAVYQKMLNTRHTIGGSYVGDLFYNFKGGYWLIALLVGIFLGKVSISFDDSINKKAYSKLIYSIPVLYNCFWWVRDAVGNELRPVVWQIVISVIVVSYYKKRYYSKEVHI